MKLVLEISVLSFPLDRVGRVLLVSTYFWWTPVERAKRVWKSVSGVRRRYSKAAVKSIQLGRSDETVERRRSLAAGIGSDPTPQSPLEVAVFGLAHPVSAWTAPGAGTVRPPGSPVAPAPWPVAGPEVELRENPHPTSGWENIATANMPAGPPSV
jgi:hypothetical protein